MQKIAIIVPCYNEEKRLNEQKVKHLIENSDVDIYFANDGSKDNTIKMISEFSNSFPDRTKILDYSVNEGKANTIYKSLNHIQKENKYDYIGYFDADFSTPSDELIRMINNLRINNYQLIFGSRVLLLNAKINRKWQRHIIGRIIITLINSKFKLGIYDTQCGAKIFSKDLIPSAFSKPFYTSWLFDVEMFIRLRRENLLGNACEFPLKEWRDVEGSKLSWKTSFKIIKELNLLFKNY